MKLPILVTFVWVATLVSAVPTNRSKSINQTTTHENIHKVDGVINVITAGNADGRRYNTMSSAGRTEKRNLQHQHVSDDAKTLADGQSFEGNLTKSSSLRSTTPKNVTLALKPGSRQKLLKKHLSNRTSRKKRTSKRALQGKRTSIRTHQEKRTARRALRKTRASKRAEQKKDMSRSALPAKLRKKRTSKRTLERKRMLRRALRKTGMPLRTLQDKRVSRRALRKKVASERTFQKKRVAKRTSQNKKTLAKRHPVDSRPLERHSTTEKSTGTHLVYGNATKPMSVLSEIAEHAVQAVMSTLMPNMRTKRTTRSHSRAVPISKPLVQTKPTEESKKPKMILRTPKKKISPLRGKIRPRKRSTQKRSLSTMQTPPPCKSKSKMHRRKKPKRKPHQPITSVRVNRKCFCRLVTSARKRCYVLTNEVAGKCRSKWCPFEWKCITAGHSANVCVPAVKTEKIELIPGSRTSCRKIKHPPKTSWVFYKRLKMVTP